ncbi:MAG: c-type cytochrome, partial [Planctomycetaceae bacterium]|nr:c-type cytochrome [Planctomycetaceae bacterium]
PFAFGYFEHVPHDNFQGGHVTVGGVFYQGTTFPEEFQGKYIAVDTLGHAVRWHHVLPDASSVRSQNGGVLLQANDTWFAPSDATIGPDGAVYIADWYDKRTAHPDPDATWDRSNGRVYRLQWADAVRPPTRNLSGLTDRELIEQLDSPNEWNVRRARRLLSERQSPDVPDQFRRRIRSEQDGHLGLQNVWTLAAMQGIDESLDGHLLEHPDPRIRTWMVRLFGDSKHVSPNILEKFLTLAESERHPDVVSQLASTAKRLPAGEGLSIASVIARRDEFRNDPHIPLLLWWAIEHHVDSSPQLVLQHFATAESWQSKLVSEVILGRLMRRFAGGGRLEDMAAAATLFNSSPNDAAQRSLLEELDAGLRMVNREKRSGLPLGNSFSRIAVPQVQLPHSGKRFDAVPAALEPILKSLWTDAATDPLILRLATRLGFLPAYERTCELALDRKESEGVRLASLAILLELGEAGKCVDLGIALTSKDESEAIQSAALELLSRFEDQRISSHLLNRYESLPAKLQATARGVLFGRAESTRLFLQHVDQGVYPMESVSLDELRLAALHDDANIDAIVQKNWGTIQAGTPEEKLAEIRRVSNDLRGGSGDLVAGRVVFEEHCATCHQLFGRGKAIGPDLTKANRHDREFLLSSIVDPSSQIRKEYLNYIVALQDGRVLTGVFKDQTSTRFTVIDSKDRQTTVAMEDVAEMKVSPVSLMPENLLQKLSPQQVRDLFQYLESDDHGESGNSR